MISPKVPKFIDKYEDLLIWSRLIITFSKYYLSWNKQKCCSFYCIL